MDNQLFLSELLDRLHLEVAPAVQEKLLWFLEELLRWNSKVNLTAITDPREAVEKHLVDSLTLLPYLNGAERLLDIGSGGGFPAIPLKLALPQLKLVSVDAVGKKIAFQRHIARQLQLAGFSPIASRIEDLQQKAEFAAAFDVIVARAFTALPIFAQKALPLLAAKGFLLAMKGAEGEKELREAESELRTLGFNFNAVHHLQLPASGARRTLLFLRRE